MSAGRIPKSSDLDNIKNGLTLEPHVCRRCFARIVSSLAPDGQTEYTCSSCGYSALGDTPAVVCACGIRLRRPTGVRTMGHKTVDAGVRCQPNPDPTPEFPAQYVAAHVGAGK